MTALCGTPRTSERDWDWITRHRALGCPSAVWGSLQDDT